MRCAGGISVAASQPVKENFKTEKPVHQSSE
jgi:hypothetical protein